MVEKGSDKATLLSFLSRRDLPQELWPWEIIADRLSKTGWSLGWVSAVDSQGETFWIADAHRGDGRRFIVRADGKLSAFVELEHQVLTVSFYLASIHADPASERDSLPYGAWTSLVFAAPAYGGLSLLITFWPIRKETQGSGWNESSLPIK